MPRRGEFPDHLEGAELLRRAGGAMIYSSQVIHGDGTVEDVLDDDAPVAEANDFYVLTAADITAGTATIPLTYEPEPEWLILWWRTVAQEPTEYTVNYAAQTITLPLASFAAAGDRIWVHYVYRNAFAPESPLSVPLGSTWRYKTGLGSGAAPAAVSYDDSAWAQGPSAFGWGYPSGVGTTCPSPLDVWTRYTGTTQGGALTFTADRVDNNTYIYLDGTLIASWAYTSGPPQQITVSCPAGEHVIACYGHGDGATGDILSVAVQEAS